MKIIPIALILVLTISCLMSMGAQGKTGDGGPSRASMDPPKAPFILSNLPGAKPHFWADPDHSFTVVYDRWQIFLFGKPNDNFTVRINGVEAFNGTLTGSWMNLSFNAQDLASATVKIAVGNSTWTISGLAISHSPYNGGGEIGGGSSTGKYFEQDLKNEQRNGAIGATILAIIGWVAMWFVVQWEHNRRGISHE